MYKDLEIRLEVYDNYYKLINLLKEKNSAATKLDDLMKYLNYFNNNFETFSEDEKNLIKNVLIIAEAITSSANNYYKKTKDKAERCMDIINSIKEKQKTLVK